MKKKCGCCARVLDISLESHSYCGRCGVYYCSAYNHACYMQYHHRHGLYMGHYAATVIDPRVIGEDEE